MTRLKPGDRVDCRIKSATIVKPYSSYDEIKTFEIVAYDSNGYYLYVPHYYLLKDSVVADQYQCKKLNIDRKFINENIVYIEDGFIADIDETMDGQTCKICKEFSQYAATDQDDSFICFSCRLNPYR